MVDHNKSLGHISVRGRGASNNSVIAMVVIIDVVGTLSEHVQGRPRQPLVHVEICRLNEKSVSQTTQVQ